MSCLFLLLQQGLDTARDEGRHGLQESCPLEEGDRLHPRESRAIASTAKADNADQTGHQCSRAERSCMVEVT